MSTTSLREMDARAWNATGDLAKLAREARGVPGLGAYAEEVGKALRILANAYPIVEKALHDAH